MLSVHTPALNFLCYWAHDNTIAERWRLGCTPGTTKPWFQSYIFFIGLVYSVVAVKLWYEQAIAKKWIDTQDEQPAVCNCFQVCVHARMLTKALLLHYCLSQAIKCDKGFLQERHKLTSPTCNLHSTLPRQAIGQKGDRTQTPNTKHTVSSASRTTNHTVCRCPPSKRCLHPWQKGQSVTCVACICITSLVQLCDWHKKSVFPLGSNNQQRSKHSLAYCPAKVMDATCAVTNHKQMQWEWIENTHYSMYTKQHSCNNFVSRACRHVDQCATQLHACFRTVYILQESTQDFLASCWWCTLLLYGSVMNEMTKRNTRAAVKTSPVSNTTVYVLVQTSDYDRPMQVFPKTSKSFVTCKHSPCRLNHNIWGKLHILSLKSNL